MQLTRKTSEDFKPKILVGVTGGSASGKTSICQNIADMITLSHGLKTIIIPLDCFYKPI